MGQCRAAEGTDHCTVIYYQGWEAAKGKMFCHYPTVCHHTLLRHTDANLKAYSRTRKSCSFTLWIAVFSVADN